MVPCGIFETRIYKRILPFVHFLPVTIVQNKKRSCQFISKYRGVAVEAEASFFLIPITNNYIATNKADICRGATVSFVSYDGQSGSLIMEHFVLPTEKESYG